MYGRQVVSRPISKPAIPRYAQLCAVVLVLFVWFGLVGRGGLGHPYYSGSARTLASNPRWLFSGAFDSGGFVTVDKPPIGLWPTALGVRVFGPTSIGFVLPSAIMTALAAWFVSRSVGRKMSIVVMLVVLATPGIAVLARSSLVDASMLAAGCAAAAVVLSGWGRRPLVTGGALLGIALLAKPGAVLMLPAFIVFIMTGSKEDRGLRVAQFFLAMLAIGGLWLFAASATPNRPYFGGSHENSATELLVGPASVDRVVGADLTGDGDRWIGFASAGEPGILRTISGRMGAQAGYLLLFAAFAGVDFVRRTTGRERRLGVFWLTWLLVHVAAYSFLPGIAHAYYAASLAPPIAALTVLALAHRGSSGWLLLAGVGLSLFVSFYLLPFEWPRVVWLFVLGTAGIVAGWRVHASSDKDPVAAGAIAAVVVLMMVVSVEHLITERPLSFDPAAGDRSAKQNPDERFLDLHETVSSSSARWVLATDDEAVASYLVAAEGTSVMLVGGFLDRDPITTEQELLRLVEEGEIAYVLEPSDTTSPAGKLLNSLARTCLPVAEVAGLRLCQ